MSFHSSTTATLSGQAAHKKNPVVGRHCLTLAVNLFYTGPVTPLHASAARSELNLTTISLRRKLYMAQCMFRCLSSQSPSYLSNLFSSSSSSLTTRSSSTQLLNLPPVKTSYGQKAFSFAGASLWRTLPPHIRTANNPQSFNRLAKDFYQHNC